MSWRSIKRSHQPWSDPVRLRRGNADKKGGSNARFTRHFTQTQAGEAASALNWLNAASTSERRVFSFFALLRPSRCLNPCQKYCWHYPENEHTGLLQYCE